jgi:hypothetical protein
MTSNRPQTLRPDQARCLGLSGNDRFWRKAAVHTQTASRSAYQFGIWNQARGALSRSQWEAATSMLRWRVRTSGVRRSRFHPGRESRRSVGDQCDVIPNPSAAALQNVALYRRFGVMSDVEVFEPTSLAIVSVAMRRAGESPVRPIARIGCCVSPI